MSERQGIVVVRDECRASVTLSRPEKGNALSAGLIEELDRAIRTAVQGNSRLLVIDGAGKHFCTGFDLSDIESESDATLLLRFVRIETLLQMVHSLPIASMAIGRGRCYGAGADLFAACETRVALRGAQFAFPGSGFGLVLGTARLASLVGRDAARRLVLSGKPIGAEEALGIGLVTAVLETEEQIGQLIADEAAKVARVDERTAAMLRSQISVADDDRALAALVRSAARPGLKERVRGYVERVASERRAATA
ncbi:enoyl-CoA hydratase/isomerase family protein [Mesorhizobium sp. B2-7-3]|uniref:enoyl-CoA hydratase/isomerase family protein n=1 Tax=Mesorhizobium sp. B2-7-3 TaxID=2589907 RepID=UPI00112B67A3|nr:enoyl-CoA hydratase/isomerase family protein [Mesorhizobium sp. B2-7-3]TPJ18920.1 enoyl-CoA hydratase/isomerase family protein [Mesorhizobium sp. B2-7-3]